MQILFNKTIDQCRIIGARGGRARAWNLRMRPSKPSTEPPVIVAPRLETAAEAIAPWIASSRGSSERRKHAGLSAVARFCSFCSLHPPGKR